MGALVLLLRILLGAMLPAFFRYLMDRLDWPDDWLDGWFDV